jgi:hypothetical protein
MQRVYRNVPHLSGNVVLTNHVLDKLETGVVPLDMFEQALLRPGVRDHYESSRKIWRERDGVRLIIALEPDVNVVITTFRAHTLMSLLGCPRGCGRFRQGNR